LAGTALDAPEDVSPAQTAPAGAREATADAIAARRANSRREIPPRASACGDSVRAFGSSLFTL
jgi:hypothetical protein